MMFEFTIISVIIIVEFILILIFLKITKIIDNATRAKRDINILISTLSEFREIIKIIGQDYSNMLIIKEGNFLGHKDGLPQTNHIKNIITYFNDFEKRVRKTEKLLKERYNAPSETK